VTKHRLAPVLATSGFLLAAIVFAISTSRRGRSSAVTTTPIESDEEEFDEYGYYITPEDTDDCLVLGHAHPELKFGRYRACLTNNQKRVLFKNRKGKKLGCGVFACAYGTSSPNKIVKFTRDPEDVAALLETQETGAVPEVYETYKLKEPGHAIKSGKKTPVYALVIERLKTFTSEKRSEIDAEFWGPAAGRSGNLVKRVLDEVAVGEAPSISKACRAIRDYEGESCGMITQKTAEAVEKLRTAHVDVSGVLNDLHAGNIGLDKDGNVKILDLGFTGTRLKEQPKILAKATKRLARRRLKSA